VPDPSAPGAPGALPRGLLEGLAPVPDPQAPQAQPAARGGTAPIDALAATAVAGAGGGSAAGDAGTGADAGAGQGTTGAPPSAAPAVTQVGVPGATFRTEQVEATSATTRTAEQQSPPVVDQVTRHVLAARSLGDGIRETVLHLTPDHLGAVTVTLQVQGTDVRLDLAANQAALDTLNAGLGELRDELGAAGLDLTDVTLRPDDGGRQEGRAPGQEGPADGRQDGRPAPGGDGRATDRGPDRRTGGPGQAAGIGPENRPGRSSETGPGETRRGQPLDIRV
jgi:hypothetical protein